MQPALNGFFSGKQNVNVNRKMLHLSMLFNLFCFKIILESISSQSVL